MDTDFIGSCRNLYLCCLLIVVTEQGRVYIFMMIGCSIAIVFSELDGGDGNIVRESGDELLWV